MVNRTLAVVAAFISRLADAVSAHPIRRAFVAPVAGVVNADILFAPKPIGAVGVAFASDVNALAVYAPRPVPAIPIGPAHRHSPFADSAAALFAGTTIFIGLAIKGHRLGIVGAFAEGANRIPAAIAARRAPWLKAVHIFRVAYFSRPTPYRSAIRFGRFALSRLRVAYLTGRANSAVYAIKRLFNASSRPPFA